jgi:hypothetical protein
LVGQFTSVRVIRWWLKGTARGSGAHRPIYGAIVKAAIKSTVVFTDEVTATRMAKIEVVLTLTAPSSASGWYFQRQQSVGRRCHERRHAPADAAM